MRSATVARAAGLTIGALALSGCAALLPPTPGGPPVSSPRPEPRAEAPVAEPTPEMLHFRRLEADRLVRGLLRTDGGGPDTPFTPAMVEANFIRVALYDEYGRTGLGVTQRPQSSRLRRFDAPVRLHLDFDDSLPPEAIAEDRSRVAAYAARLARVTGHPVSVTAAADQANFHVLVLSEASRRASGDRLRSVLPELDDATLRLVTDLPLSISCLALALSDRGTGAYTRAIAIVRSELPDLSRTACYHEEIAQGLGLANDSPQARPSIFNDSMEFAYLTTHDEYLLRILYDPRLQPGMTEAEARPIVRRIVAGLMGGQS